MQPCLSSAMCAGVGCHLHAAVSGNPFIVRDGELLRVRCYSSKPLQCAATWWPSFFFIYICMWVVSYLCNGGRVSLQCNPCGIITMDGGCVLFFEGSHNAVVYPKGADCLIHAGLFVESCCLREKPPRQCMCRPPLGAAVAISLWQPTHLSIFWYVVPQIQYLRVSCNRGRAFLLESPKNMLCMECALFFLETDNVWRSSVSCVRDPPSHVVSVEDLKMATCVLYRVMAFLLRMPIKYHAK